MDLSSLTKPTLIVYFSRGLLIPTPVLSLITLINELNNTNYGYNYHLNELNTKYRYNIFQKTLNHLFQVGDLKLYAKNDNELEFLLITVKRFSDTGIELGLYKCPKATFRQGKLFFRY